MPNANPLTVLYPCRHIRRCLSPMALPALDFSLHRDYLRSVLVAATLVPNHLFYETPTNGESDEVQ